MRKVKLLNMNAIGVFFQSPASILSGTREKVPFRAEVWAYSLTREPVKVPRRVQSKIAALRSNRMDGLAAAHLLMSSNI